MATREIRRQSVEFAQPEGYRPLELDLYASTRGGPLVVFLHGGGWRRGSRRWFGPAFEGRIFTTVAARGYVVASLDYRLSGEAVFPAQLQDVLAGLEYLAVHAPGLGADIERTVLWGESAGGHLAALAALARPTGPPLVAGVVDWYGPSDLRTMAAQARPDALVRADDVDSREALLLGEPVALAGKLAAQASPVAQVHAGAPPFLLMHGTADRFVPVGQSRQLHEALTAAGASSQLEVVEGADHMWMGADPQAVLDVSLAFVGRVTGRTAC